jgi:hypothetical protein
MPSQTPKQVLSLQFASFPTVSALAVEGNRKIELDANTFRRETIDNALTTLMLSTIKQR